MSGSINPVSAVSIAGSSTLALNLAGNSTFANTVANDGLLTTIQSGTTTVSGRISGIGAVTQNGTGLTSLTGTNTYSGATTVSKGTLQIGDGVSGSINAVSAVGVAENATLVLNLAGNSLFANMVGNDGLMTAIQSGTTTISGLISGIGALTQNGTGLTILTGSNIYSGPTTVSKGTLQIGDGTSGSINGNSAVTIAPSAALVLNLAGESVFANTIGNDGLLTAIQSGTTTISGNVSGLGALTQNGTGLTILTGSNSYSGPTTVSKGTLQIGDGLNGSINSVSDVSVATDATLALNLTGESLFANKIANDGLVTAIQSGTTTVSGAISGAGALTQNGNGLTILTGSNSYSGATTVSKGTLQVGDDLNGSINGVSAVTVASGATLALKLAGNSTFSNPVANDGLVTTIQSGTTTVSGAIGGSGALTQDGVGRTILTESNSYLGATTVSAGTLQIGNGMSGSISAASAVTIAPAATLELNLSNMSAFANTVFDDGTLAMTQSGATTVSGMISGSGEFIQSGSGLTLVTGANTYTGPTTVSNGTLRIGDGMNGSISGASQVVIGTLGTAVFDLAGNATAANTVINEGSLITMQSGTTTFSGSISGAGALQHDGPGRTILTGSNSYTGNTAVFQGTLQVGNGTSGSIDGASAVWTNAGAGLEINLVDGGIFANNVVNDGLITTIQTETNTLSGVISGGGGLTVNSSDGLGVTVLTGANTYSGRTSILNGALQAGAANVIGSSSAVIIDSNGTFLLNGFDQSVGSVADGVNGGGVIQLGAATLAAGSDGTDTVFSGVIDGDGGITKLGAGTWTLSNHNSYLGKTSILEGTLRAGAGNAISKSSAVEVNSGATFDLNGKDQSVGSIADGPDGGGSILQGSASLTTGYDNTSTTFAGVISGDGLLTKLGEGRWELAGENTNTGLTRVLGGNLAVNGAIGGNAVVAHGATLSGNGTVHGGVINSGTVSPGNSPGALTIAGNYVQTVQGRYLVELGSLTSYDQLKVGGSVSLDGTVEVAYLNGFQVKKGDKFTFVTSGSGVSRYHMEQFIDPHATGTLLTLGITVTPHQMVLEMIQGSFASVKGLTPNEKAVGRALDSGIGNSRMAKLIDYLDTVKVGDVPETLALLAPTDYAAIFQAGFASAQVQATNLERRMSDIRNGITGFSASGLAVTNAHGALNFDELPPVASNGRDADDAVALEGKNVRLNHQADNRWGFFATGSGEFETIDATADAPGSDFTTGGMTVGADYRINRNAVAGANLGYVNTTISGRGDGSIKIGSGKAGLYGTAFNGNYYLNGALEGGWNSYDTKRETVGGIARGSTTGMDFSALLGGGYDFHRNQLLFGPVASVQYTNIGIDAFTEKGSLAPLRFDSQNQDSFRTTLGFRTAYAWNVGGIVVIPELRAQWQHEFANNPLIAAGFIGGGAFGVTGPQVGRDSLRLDVGFSVQVTPAVSVFGSYNGDIGTSNYILHSVNGGVRVSF